MSRGTLAISWGHYGGFYVHWKRRVCLGWVAFTYTPVELDMLMEGYVIAIGRHPEFPMEDTETQT